jgi:DNA replication protein DnaC
MSALSLPILLRSLGLTSMAREHDAALARAETEDWGYPRLLRHLVETEANERLRRRVERLLKASRLPAGKTMASVEPARLPDKVRRQLPTLLTGEFIRRGDNLLCFGLPGRGKTLFLAALCRELVQRIDSILLLPKEGCCLIINVTNGNDFRRTNKMEVIHECFNDGASAPGTSGGVAAAIRGSNTGREG